MLVEGLSIEDYHGEGDWVSNSGMRTFHKKGPMTYWARHVKRRDEAKIPRTEPMSFGIWFEDYLNESLGEEGAFDMYETATPDFNARLKKDREWRDGLTSQGITVITEKDVLMMEGMLEGIKDIPGLWELLEESVTQPTYRTTEPGLPSGIQSRPDWTLPQNEMFGLSHIDLKTCMELNGFESSVFKWGYHTQAACVRRTAGIDGAYFLLACEKAYPYGAQLVQLSDEYIDVADRWVSRQIAGIAACYHNGKWPRVAEPARMIGPPNWLRDQEGSS